MNFKYGWTVEGHAEYAEEGKDIVCSAVSVLTQTILHSMLNVTRAFHIKEKGLMDVNIEHLTRESVVLSDTLLWGLREIERAFPEYVKIIYT